MIADIGGEQRVGQDCRPHVSLIAHPLLPRRTIMEDPFIRNYVEDLLKKIRTQVWKVWGHAWGGGDLLKMIRTQVRTVWGHAWGGGDLLKMIRTQAWGETGRGLACVRVCVG